jgi:hypothetical protein
MAAAQMERFVEQTQGAEDWAVLPTMLNPFVWDGIIKTRTDWVKLEVHATQGVRGELARVERGGFSEIARQAAQAKTAAALLRFARFPAVRVETTGAGYRVLFMDFRFYNEQKTLGAEVLLNRSHEVTKETLSFVLPVTSP